MLSRQWRAGLGAPPRPSPALEKPLARREIHAGEIGRIPREKMRSFLRDVDALIADYNHLISSRVPPEDIMARKEALLLEIRSKIQEFNDRFPQPYLAEAAGYRALSGDLFDQVNSRLRQYAKPAPIMMRAGPLTVTAADMLMNMSQVKADRVCFLLMNHAPIRRLKDELSSVYAMTEVGEEAERFRQFLAQHEIRYLGGHNSRNFKITSRLTGQEEVLQLQNMFNMPRLVERTLRQQLTTEMLPIKAERLAVSRDVGGVQARTLVLTEYCQGNLMESSQRYRARGSEDALLRSVYERFEQMAITFLKMQENRIFFPDAKVENWLVNERDELRIADTKAFVFVDDKGYYSPSLPGNQYSGSLSCTPGCVPPEFRGLNVHADHAHAFLLGINMYYYMTKMGHRGDEGARFDFRAPIFRSPQGRVLKDLIVRLARVRPEDRLSMQDACSAFYFSNHPEDGRLFRDLQQRLSLGAADPQLDALIAAEKKALMLASEPERQAIRNNYQVFLRRSGKASLSDLLHAVQGLRLGDRDSEFNALEGGFLNAHNLNERMERYQRLDRWIGETNASRLKINDVFQSFEHRKLAAGDDAIRFYLDEKYRQLGRMSLSQRVDSLMVMQDVHRTLPLKEEVDQVLTALSAETMDAKEIKQVREKRQRLFNGPIEDRRQLVSELKDMLVYLQSGVQAREEDDSEEELLPVVLKKEYDPVDDERREKDAFDNLYSLGLDSRDRRMNLFIQEKRQALEKAPGPSAYRRALLDLEQTVVALAPSKDLYREVFNLLETIEDDDEEESKRIEELKSYSPQERYDVLIAMKENFLNKLQRKEEQVVDDLESLVFPGAHRLQELIREKVQALRERPLEERGRLLKELQGFHQSIAPRSGLLPRALLRKLEANLILGESDAIAKSYIDKAVSDLRRAPLETWRAKWDALEDQLATAKVNDLQSGVAFDRIMNELTRQCIGPDDVLMQNFIRAKKELIIEAPLSERPRLLLALQRELNELIDEPGMQEMRKIIEVYRRHPDGRLRDPGDGKARKGAHIEAMLARVPIEERQRFIHSTSPESKAVMEVFALRRRRVFEDTVPRTAGGEIDVARAPKGFQAFMAFKEKFMAGKDSKSSDDEVAEKRGPE